MPEEPSQYVNYPRENTGGPNFRPPGVYLDIFGDAWRLFSQEMATWIGATIVVMLVGALLYGASFALSIVLFLAGDFARYLEMSRNNTQSTEFSIQSSLVGLPFGALIGMLQLGMISMAVRQARGLPIGIGDVFQPFARFLPVFGVILVTQILSSIGFLLCLVPGIYLTGAFSLAPMIVFAQGAGVFEGISRSTKTLGSQAWMMFVLYFVVGFVIALGGCLCGVGLLATIPLGAICIGLHYHYFFPPAPIADAATSYGY